MLDFSQFEVLTFDCYGTLVDWEKGILGCLHRILSAHAKNADDTSILELYGDFEALAEAGEYRPYRTVLESVVTMFGKHFGFVPTAEEVSSLPESLKRWEVWPDTPPALRELQTHFKLAIISNVDDDLFAATQPKLGVEFDQVITAQQAAAYKPSNKIFELALNRIAAAPQRILHVGQSLYHDVLPAQALGLSTIWVSRPSPRSGIGAVKRAEARPDLQVSSLAELARLARS